MKIYQMKIMEKIKRYIAERKKHNRSQKEFQLKAEFKVVERGGHLWLTHCDVAFMKVPAMLNAERISELLNEARECAVEFEKS